jgi:hypothetical protein
MVSTAGQDATRPFCCASDGDRWMISRIYEVHATVYFGGKTAFQRIIDDDRGDHPANQKKKQLI